MGGFHSGSCLTGGIRFLYHGDPPLGVKYFSLDSMATLSNYERGGSPMMRDDEWVHARLFFREWGCSGGLSRSPRKLEAVRKNLVKANEARRAAVQARGQQRARQQAGSTQAQCFDPPASPS